MAELGIRNVYCSPRFVKKSKSKLEGKGKELRFGHIDYVRPVGHSGRKRHRTGVQEKSLG